MEHLLESLDIGSGLTRKQTIKRKFRNLSKNTQLNNLFHKRVALDRQLKALLKDLRISSLKDFSIYHILFSWTIFHFQRVVQCKLCCIFSELETVK